MGVEIERKFLVTGDDWKTLGSGTYLRQGYICSDPSRIVRVRIAGDVAFLTMKGMAEGISRAEWEYDIPVADAKQLLDTLCEKPLIEKTRYRIPLDGVVWEVDEFYGDNAGLVVAEIELESERQHFLKPAWIAEEVSADHRYANANLLKHPYSSWLTSMD